MAGTAVHFSEVSVGRDIRIEKIQNIAAVYRIYPGVRRISTSAKSRVDRVLTRYELFAGRDTELEQLNSFVARRSSGYLLVTGPSGFGKSALLANCLKLFQEACYHFVSRPDGIADEELAVLSLCQQLAAFHDLGGELPITTTELRSLYASLLTTPPVEGRKLIVVLDGIDEALNWTPGADLFPRLPPGVFVVFSAGSESDSDWLTKLGLSPDMAVELRLQGLATKGILDLLKRAGVASASLTAGFVEKLSEISEGDPFYLRFLVEDIRAGLITEINIGQQPRGLKGYFSQRWDELKEDVRFDRQEITDLLGVLAVAKGPLLPRELAGICPTLRRGAMLNQELSGKLKRYLIGDAEEGYSLWHHRFSEYLQGIFFAEEVEGYRNSLLAYCSRWREHRSNYALSYYSAHLIELSRDAELFALINKEWLDARFSLTGSDRAFAGDVEAAINASIKEPTVGNLVQMVRNSFVAGTLRSRTERIAPRVLALLAHLGNPDRAIAYASLQHNPETQIETWCEIAVELDNFDRSDEASEILERAIVLAEGIDSWKYGPSQLGFSGAPLLARVALALVNTSRSTRAGEIAKRSIALGLAAPGRFHPSILRSIAISLGKAGLVGDAVEAMATIRDYHDLVEPLAECVRALVRLGKIERALALCKQLTKPWEQIPQLISLIEVLIDSNSREAASAVADLAVTAAVSADDKWYKPPLLAQAARALTLVEHPERSEPLVEMALAIGESLTSLDRAWALAGVSRGLAQSGEAVRALDIAHRVISSDHPSEQRAQGAALWEVAKAFAREGEIERSISQANKAQVLSRSMHAGGTTPVEYELPEIGFGNFAPNTPLVDVIELLAKSGQIDRSIAELQNLCIPTEREACAAAVAQELRKARLFDRALDVVAKIADGRERGNQLSEIAYAMAVPGDAAKAKLIADDAIRAAQELVSPWNGSWTLVEFCEALAGAAQFERADSAARSIADPEAQAWAYLAVGRELASAQKHEEAIAAVERAIAAADRVEPELDPAGLMRGKVIFSPESNGARIMSAIKHDLFRPVMQRAMQFGWIVGPNYIGDQNNVTALILLPVVEVMLQAGAVSKAEEAIEKSMMQSTVQNRQMRSGEDFIRGQAVVALLRIGLIERAQVLAESIDEPARGACALALVGAAYSRKGQTKQALAAADRATATVLRREASHIFDEIADRVTVTFLEAGLMENALKINKDLDGLITRMLNGWSYGAISLALEQLLPVRDSSHLNQFADRAGILAEDDIHRLIRLVQILHLLNILDRLPGVAIRARAAFESMPDKPGCVEARMEFAAALDQAGDKEQALGILREAIALLEHVDDPHERSSLRVNIVSQLTTMGRTDVAVEVANQFPSGEFKARALRQVLPGLVEQGLVADAVKIAHQIAEVAERTDEPAEKANCYVTAAWALGGVGEGGDAATALFNAILTSRLSDRHTLLEILRMSAALLFSLDSGEMMWEIHEALQESDSWWSSGNRLNPTLTPVE